MGLIKVLKSAVLGLAVAACGGNDVQDQREVSITDLDLCDGIDNNENGKVDELGCGWFIYGTEEEGGSRIASLDLVTGEREEISDFFESAQSMELAVSPNGERIAFAPYYHGEFGGSNTIYIRTLPDRDLHALVFENPVFDRQRNITEGIAWKDDNTLIFAPSIDDRRVLYQVGTDGSWLEQLFPNSDRGCSQYNPWVQGDELVYQHRCFHSYEVYDYNFREIVHYSFATGEETAFRGDDGSIRTDPTLHGKWIFFKGLEPGEQNYSLQRVRVGRGHPETVYEKIKEGYVVSPDGHSVVIGDRVVDLESGESFFTWLNMGQSRAWLPKD